MKVYGKYKLEDAPFSLAEVTLQVSAEELRKIIDFFEHCSAEMMLNDQWEHAQLQDFFKSSYLSFDLVIYKA
ncbi:hypothetical protein [Xanthomonas graminis]|uniref:hypothetical protein n=1 Tax=Xanthomonas graminis TaxID=3390026 RepID=UPI000A9EAD18|nr:hypothetical protein [Xanthomonas translucens]UKE62273.1 hypothetical protein KM539_01525 [Xanthomonas translucens pv. poae]